MKFPDSFPHEEVDTLVNEWKIAGLDPKVIKQTSTQAWGTIILLLPTEPWASWCVYVRFPEEPDTWIKTRDEISA
jgi:hypothetical protein